MTVSSSCSARIANASFVAALAVVLLHVCIAGTNSGSSVLLVLRDFSRFAVPFFFLVSGYLLAGHADESGWWRRETVKRFRTLMVPYLVWSVLFGLYLLIGMAVPELQRTHAFDFAGWWREKALMLSGLDLRQFPLMLPLWYLRTLMILVLLSGVLTDAVRHWGRGTLVTFGAIYLVYAVSVDWHPELTSSTIGSLLRATFAPEAFFYFVTGLWLRFRGGEPKARNPVPFLGTAVMLLIVRQLVGPWLPHPVVIPFALYGVWCAVPEKPWPKMLTALSFPIYLMHWFPVHAIACSYPELGANSASVVLVFAGVVSVNVVAALAIRRFAPRFTSVLFGGR